jgi:hypothetical protein
MKLICPICKREEEVKEYSRDNKDCWCYCLDKPTFMLIKKDVKVIDKIIKRLKGRK